MQPLSDMFRCLSITHIWNLVVFSFMGGTVPTVMHFFSFFFWFVTFSNLVCKLYNLNWTIIIIVEWIYTVFHHFYVDKWLLQNTPCSNLFTSRLLGLYINTSEIPFFLLSTCARDPYNVKQIVLSKVSLKIVCISN